MKLKSVEVEVEDIKVRAEVTPVEVKIEEVIVEVELVPVEEEDKGMYSEAEKACNCNQGFRTYSGSHKLARWGYN